MQGSPSLLTVKQVATALQIDERSVREKLTLGTLKGTKKTVGQKEQWFVHQRDLDAELVRRGQSPINLSSQVAGQPPITSEIPQPHIPTQTVYQPEAAPPQGNFAPPPQPANAHQYAYSQPSQPPDVQNPPPAMATAQTSPAQATPTATESQAQAATATITAPEYVDVTDATELEALADGSIFENEGAAAATSGGNVRGWRNETLEKQMEAAVEKFLKPAMDKIEDLTKDNLLKDLKIKELDDQLKLLPDFEAQKKKLLAEIEAERLASEIQFNKANEKEQEARALEAENAMLKQKAEEAVLSAAKLADLEKVVQELQKPKPTLWQKFFGTQSEK